MVQLTKENTPRKQLIAHTKMRLTQMEQRLKEVSQTSRLLRPSQLDEDLLRPAKSPGMEETDQLLRPTTADAPPQPRSGSDA